VVRLGAPRIKACAGDSEGLDDAGWHQGNLDLGQSAVFWSFASTGEPLISASHKFAIGRKWH